VREVGLCVRSLWPLKAVVDHVTGERPLPATGARLKYTPARDDPRMRNRLWGLIGVVWGGAIVLRRLFLESPAPESGGAYAAGQTVGVLFGMVMVAIGLYYLVKKPVPK
jgi:hypothetical protein